jgi:hypothetical protein
MTVQMWRSWEIEVTVVAKEKGPWAVVQRRFECGSGTGAFETSVVRSIC